MFGGVITGKMEIEIYLEIEKSEVIKELMKQIIMANYLLCNRSVSSKNVDDDLTEMVIKYYWLLNAVAIKAKFLTDEVEFDDYEPPVPKVSRAKTSEFTIWLYMLYKKMVKLDPGKFLNKITEMHLL
jgi:hypothetical protein